MLFSCAATSLMFGFEARCMQLPQEGDQQLSSTQLTANNMLRSQEIREHETELIERIKALCDPDAGILWTHSITGGYYRYYNPETGRIVACYFPESGQLIGYLDPETGICCECNLKTGILSYPGGELEVTPQVFDKPLFDQSTAGCFLTIQDVEKNMAGLTERINALRNSEIGILESGGYYGYNDTETGRMIEFYNPETGQVIDYLDPETRTWCDYNLKTGMLTCSDILSGTRFTYNPETKAITKSDTSLHEDVECTTYHVATENPIEIIQSGDYFVVRESGLLVTLGSPLTKKIMQTMIFNIEKDSRINALEQLFKAKTTAIGSKKNFLYVCGEEYRQVSEMPNKAAGNNHE